MRNYYDLTTTSLQISGCDASVGDKEIGVWSEVNGPGRRPKSGTGDYTAIIEHKNAEISWTGTLRMNLSILHFPVLNRLKT